MKNLIIILLAVISFSTTLIAQKGNSYLLHCYSKYAKGKDTIFIKREYIRKNVFVETWKDLRDTFKIKRNKILMKDRRGRYHLYFSKKKFRKHKLMQRLSYTRKKDNTWERWCPQFYGRKEVMIDDELFYECAYTSGLTPDGIVLLYISFKYVELPFHREVHITKIEDLTTKQIVKTFYRKY